MKSQRKATTRRKPYTLKGGALSIAGRKVAGDVDKVIQARDDQKGRDLIIALLVYSAPKVIEKFGRRNVVAFTLDGKRAWRIQEASRLPKALTRQRVYVDVHRHRGKMKAFTYSGEVWLLNVADGSVEFFDAHYH